MKCQPCTGWIDFMYTMAVWKIVENHERNLAKFFGWE